MFWIVANGKDQIVSEHVVDNSQDTLLTRGKTALVANIVVEGVMMKE